MGRKAQRQKITAADVKEQVDMVTRFVRHPSETGPCRRVVAEGKNRVGDTIRNLAAALEAGFITENQLPDELVGRWNK